MNDEKEINIQNKKDFDFKYADFLKNGNLVTFESNNDSSSEYPSVSIYYLVKDKWKRKTFYIFNEKDISFGDFTNDKMWMLVYGLIYILDLSTFKFQKIPLFVSICSYYIFIIYINIINQ